LICARARTTRPHLFRDFDCQFDWQEAYRRVILALCWANIHTLVVLVGDLSVAGGVAQRETGTGKADWCEDGALGRTARYGTLRCSAAGLP
jgi:hypothetical protein